MTIYTRFDRTDLIGHKVTKEGYLLVEGYMARPGVMSYKYPDGRIVRELVPEEELHKKDSLNTIGRKPVTLEHPPVNVTPDNVDSYGVGDLDSDVTIGDNGFVKVKVAVRSRKAITAVKDGKHQLSPGYDVELEETPGVHPKYGAYDAIQRNRVYNHLAIVSKARGGDEIRLRLDAADQITDEDEMNPKDGVIPPVDTKGTLLTKLALDSLGLSEGATEADVVKAVNELKADKSKAEADEAAKVAAAKVEADKVAPPAPEPKKTDDSSTSSRSDADLIAYGNERAELLALASKHNIQVKADEGNEALCKELATKLVPSCKKDASKDYYQAMVDIAKVDAPKTSLDQLSFPTAPSKIDSKDSTEDKDHPVFAQYTQAHKDLLGA